MNSTHCPNCNKDIGKMAIFKAGLPNMIKCPHCKTALKYHPIGWGMVSISLLIASAMMIIIALQIAKYDPFGTTGNLMLVLFVTLIIWFPFEIYFTHRLRSKHELRIK